MSVRFKDREGGEVERLSAIVFDFDGTFYHMREQEQQVVWAESRKMLAYEIIKAIEGKDAADSASSEKVDQVVKIFVWIATKNGWLTTFKLFGGSERAYKESVTNVDKASFLKYDSQLAELVLEIMHRIPTIIFTGSGRESVLAALGVLIGEELARFYENNLLATDDLSGDYSKPNKKAYRELIKKFMIEAGTSVYVDDMLVEIQSAAAAGFRHLVWINTDSELHGNFIEIDGVEVLVLNSIHHLLNYLEFVDDRV